MFAFKLSNPDNYVIGTHRGAFTESPAGSVLVSEADMNTVLSNGKLHYIGSNDPKWRYTGGSQTVVQGTLVSVPDPRPLAGWITESGTVPSGDVDIVVDVGDPEPNLFLRLAGSNFTGIRRLGLSSGHVMRLDFVNGEAPVSISTAEPYTAIVEFCDLLQINNRLRIRVFPSGFYRLS